MPGGSNLRQCTHCLEKMNCANRRCTKCGKLLDMKCRQTARMKVFRTRAKEWAQKVKKSRNQAKTFDNSALLVEKLKALGYFPLLLWGKYRPQNKKWTVQLQCPFELPVVAHAVLEKIVCLFEGLLEACGPEREEVGQQERTGEEDEAEEEIDEEGQRGQGEQCKIGETGRRDMEEIEIEAQEDRVESERVEKGEMEGQEELEGMETEEEVGQQKRTGEEDEAEEEMDEDQRGQGEQCKIGETGRRDMEEIEIEAQEDRVESERLEKGEMEGQEEVGGMETEEMEADKEKEQTEEVGKIEIEVKKKVVAASRKSAVKISAKKKRIKRRQNKDDACQCHSTLDIFPVQYVSKTREKKPKGLAPILGTTGEH